MHGPVRSTIGLSVEVLTDAGSLEGLRDDYERLLKATQNTLPFALHEWHVAWCGHFLDFGSRFATQPRIHVVRNSEGVCVAIVPLILTRRAMGPLRLSKLDLLGADPAITEIRTLLIEPGYHLRTALAMRDALAPLRSVDWINWGGVDEEYAGALARETELQFQPPLFDYVLDLPASWETFRANLKRNVRESIRHCYNSLKRDGLSCELQIAQEPAAVKDALETFFKLHAMRASLKGTVVHPNHFAAERVRSFLRDACARLAARDVVRIFQLVVRGEVVALRIGFMVGDSLYMYYSGFDPHWSKYSVMTTTLVEAIRYAIAQGVKTINLSPGKDVSKTRWGPREVPITQAVEVNPSRFSQLAWRSFQRAEAGGRVSNWTRRVLRTCARGWR